MMSRARSCVAARTTGRRDTGQRGLPASVRRTGTSDRRASVPESRIPGVASRDRSRARGRRRGILRSTAHKPHAARHLPALSRNNHRGRTSVMGACEHDPSGSPSTIERHDLTLDRRIHCSSPPSPTARSAPAQKNSQPGGGSLDFPYRRDIALGLHWKRYTACQYDSETIQSIHDPIVEDTTPRHRRPGRLRKRWSASRMRNSPPI